MNLTCSFDHRNIKKQINISLNNHLAHYMLHHYRNLKNFIRSLNGNFNRTCATKATPD